LGKKKETQLNIKKNQEAQRKIGKQKENLGLDVKTN
jgi:hypothetical protein